VLQADLDARLRHYDHERPHLGYRDRPPPVADSRAVRQPVTRKTRG
jgi:hypothetical protein